nr:MAG TPA: hypothetical protein [Caudoviricetes sp.]
MDSYNSSSLYNSWTSYYCRCRALPRHISYRW